jgi:glycosyltransferase involved in cell wall biosynthesis
VRGGGEAGGEPRVALDVRALAVPALAERGIGRYVRCLLDALEAAGRPVVALGRERPLPRPTAPARFAEALEHVLLARDVRAAGARVLHSPSIDWLSLRPGAPLVVTLHDLVPLKRPAEYLRTGLKHRLRYAAVRRAARVIVPARAVAADAEELLGVAPERIAVVPEAPAPAFAPVEDPRAALQRLTLPEEFLLWVGGLDPPDPRKGLDALAAAVRDGDGPPLVLAGRASAEAERLAAPGRVALAGRVSDAELAALYTAAAALVLPSEDEGFGLPAVEALACGTPVAAYATGALPETLAGARGVALVAPGDPTELLAAAARLAGTPAAPPPRTWADVARETWAVYEAAAGR